MKYILPFHIGGGNRGCEGISRGVSKILNATVDDLILFENQYQVPQPTKIENAVS